MVTKTSSKEVKSGIPFGLISYVLGIVAIVEAFFSPFAGIVLSIIGIAFSKKENSDFSRKGKKLNLIALIVGIIVLILTVLVAYYASPIFGV